MSIRYLTVEEVYFINIMQIKTHSPKEQIGIKEPSLLDSAMNRPRQSAFGVDAYPDIPRKAAALFESLAQNHPFFNANKRTAFMALYTFLRYNGYHLKMDPSFADDFTVDVVNHNYPFADMVFIIQENMVKS